MILDDFYERILCMIHKDRFYLFMVLAALFIMPAIACCSAIELTSKERSWLAAHRNNLILAPTPNYPPIDFFDENGKHSGVGGDVLRLIEERLNINFQRQKLASWNDVKAAGQAGTIDLTTIAHRTEKRGKFWLFTRTYITAPTVILSRVEMEKDISLATANSLKIGMVRGYAIDEYLQLNFPDLNIVAVTDDLTGLRMLSMGELDAMITDLPTAGYLISQQRIGNLRIAGQTGYTYDYAIAVKKDLPILRDILDKCLANISPKELEETTRKWFRIQVKPFYMETKFWLISTAIFILLGAIIFAVVILNRSLKREVKKRTLELTQAHERLSRIFDSATQVAVIATDPDGKIKLFNPGAEKILGYSAAEIVEIKNITEIHTRTELESRGRELSQQYAREISGFAVLAALPTQKEMPEKREWSYIGKDGHKIPVDLGVSVIKDHKNQISGYLAVAVDISDRKKAEAALRDNENKLYQAEKISAIGQLAGGIAHDFNNQLAGIMGFAELLYQNSDDPKAKEFATQITAAAERGAHLTQQLLAFSRKGKFLNVATDTHKVIDEVVKILQRSIDKTIEIKTQLTAESYMIMGDPTQLQNALLNLALNARDAMPNGGDLVFSSQIRDFPAEQPLEELSQGKHICISVNDSGMGMDAETQRRLFEPFFTTKEVGKGTGLGLPSVYGMVKNHGGAIRVYSEAGQGSTISIYLPLSEKSAGQQNEDLPPDIIMGNSEKIMIVDDEPAVIAFASIMLEGLGYEPIAFTGSAEALKYYQQNWQSVALVIFDMVMPRQNGKDFFMAMKQINPQIKAVLVSGFSVNGAVQGILDLGVLSFMQKPFNRRELAGNLAKALTTKA